MDQRSCWLRLQLTSGLGRTGLLRLIERFGSPQAAIEAADRWRTVPGVRSGTSSRLPPADDPRLAAICERLDRLGIWLLARTDADYPAPLKNIADPPALLYGRGQRRFGEALAIVGSRQPSATGRVAAEIMAREIAANGLIVVSGLARGIDAAAHRGALTAGGHTIAVLGCGIDRVYPAENARLFAQIAESGTLLSEYPPGSEPLAGNFPARNRIISGLSRGTLVIEAAADSGSLITADLALDQGREVFAVPGSIDRPTSTGPNRLIKDGAHPVTEAGDILSILRPGQCRRPTPSDETFAAALDEPARSVWGRLSHTPRHVDELAGELGLTAGELSAILLHLELLGGAEQLPGARYVRVRNPSGSL
ncbi:MAG: DNA-protecting protein DprA [Deltaproteobacteria bacterium]|nr:MAG: DNA-protecting protein DprA [Deltaproteobacteria bacterium]